MRNDFIAVIGKKFVQIGHSVVDVCGFVLLAFLVEHRSAHEIARIDRRQDDFPEGGRVVESAQAVFSERPSRRKTLAVGVVGAEVVEKTDELRPER